MKKKVNKQARVFSWSLTKRIENQYKRDLVNVSREINKIITRYVTTNKSKFGEKIHLKDIKGLEKLLKNYSTTIVDWSRSITNRMFTSLEKSDLHEWERRSKKISQALKNELSSGEIHDRMKLYMDENVNLITSLPIRAAERVHYCVQQNLKTGQRAETLIEEIFKTGRVSESQARTIARTETSRAATGLVKVRAESIDINYFIWHCTHDNRLRKSHKIMDGVLCRWDDPPSPEKLAGEKSVGDYLPGAIWNCRCYAEPVVDIIDVSFPAKVYSNGSIQRMNKQQFMKLAGNEILISKMAA